MAQPRPSLTLILDIDERFDSEETRLEVGRCYTSFPRRRGIGDAVEHGYRALAL